MNLTGIVAFAHSQKTSTWTADTRLKPTDSLRPGWPEKELYEALAEQYQPITGIDISRRAGAHGRYPQYPLKEIVQKKLAL